MLGPNEEGEIVPAPASETWSGKREEDMTPAELQAMDDHLAAQEQEWEDFCTPGGGIMGDDFDY